MDVDANAASLSAAPGSSALAKQQNAWVTCIMKGGVPFFWGFTLSLLYTSQFVTIPTVTEEPLASYLSYFVYFIFVESVMNWILIARIRKIRKQDFQGLDTSSGEWRHCELCRTVAPPRSHHCHVCNTCILRRDHHCYFTGSCVGHSNQRRFIVLLLYLTFGSILGFILNILYVHQTLPLHSDFMYYLPVLFLYRYVVAGDLSVFLFLIMLQAYFCVFTLVSAAGYLAVEVMLTVRGQTQYESGRNITRYGRGGVVHNIRAVFGSLWLLPVNFLLPVSIPLPNNWETQKIHQT